VVAVAVGEGVVEVAGDGLGEAAGGWMVSHDSLSPGGVSAAAVPAVAAMMPPEVAVSTALPAARVTAVRRAYPKRM
jgi:hypothetical protein